MREFHKHNHQHGASEDRRFARGSFGDEGHHRGGRHHGRRGGGRPLEHGDMRTLMLHLIGEKPRHGYEIIKAIEELAGGAYAPSPGVIYPTLTLLEETGQITSTAEGARKNFTITAAGSEALAGSGDAVQAILLRIAASQPREAGLPVERAMENLRTALRLKLKAGALTPETVRKIADCLDMAAREIEEA